MLLNVNIYKYIGYTAIILSIYLIVDYIYNDSRYQYERFLKSKYITIKDFSEDELKNTPKPEHPHQATFQNHLMTLDPDLGYVPSNRLNEAFINKNSINTSFRNREMTWNNIPSNMGGRTRTAMFDPNDPEFNKVWAGSVSGGLWYNNDITDENSSWTSVSDFWDNLSISKIIYDPGNTNIFYVGTGEVNTAIMTYRESSSKGIGIWKTIDGGENWTLLPSTSEFDYITDIEVKTTEIGSVIYAGVASGVYQGDEHQSQPSDGLYKSSNGGETWIQVLPNIGNSDNPYTPSDIEITSAGKIYVGSMKNLDGNGGATILSSESGEINSWTIYEDYKNIIESDNEYFIPGRVVLSSCKNVPDVVYAAIGSGYLNNMNFNLSYGNYIIKTINNGNAWIPVDLPTEDGNDWASLAWHALAISVHPEDPQTVFIGGLELYRSINGGESWSDLSEWDLMYYGGGPRYIHADIHQINFKPNNYSAISVTSDGGIFYSNNSSTSSQDIIFNERNKGYNTLQFYTCDISPIEYGNIYVGGLQDNGTLVSGDLNDNDGEFDIMDMISGGDGAYCFFDDNDPLLITSTYYNYYFLFNMEDNSYAYANGNSGVFINPSDYDSNNNILYANKVRFNGNHANKIVKIENINPNNLDADDISFSTINLGTNYSVYFSSLKLSPYSNTLYIGNQSGRFFKVVSPNTNPSTYEIGSSYFPTANISSIDIGENDDEILVTFSNYGVSSIWFSGNGGEDWSEKEGNLPDMPVRWGILHNQDSNYSLIATEIGIWETNNFLSENVNWYPSNNGIGNVRVDMLSLRDEDNLLVAASHGRGLFHTYYNIDLIGDINNDNTLDVLDIVLLVNIILINEFNIYGDINQDGQLNVLDIVLLVNLILDS